MLPPTSKLLTFLSTSAVASQAVGIAPLVKLLPESKVHSIYKDLPLSSPKAPVVSAAKFNILCSHVSAEEIE